MSQANLKLDILKKSYCTYYQSYVRTVLIIGEDRLKNQSRVSNNRTKIFMTSTDEQFDVVKLMLTNQSKALELV